MAEEDFGKKVSNAASWSTAQTVVELIFQITTVLIFMKYLKTADYGLGAFILAVIFFGQAAIQSSFVIPLVKFSEATKPEINTFISLGYLSGCWISLAILAGGLALPSEIWNLCCLASLTFLALPLGYRGRARLQRLFLNRELAIITVAALIPAAFISWNMAELGYGPLAVVTFTSLRIAIESFILFVWTQPQPDEQQNNRVPDTIPWRLVKYGLMSTQLITALESRLDNILIGWLMGPQTLGIFDIAKKLTIEPALRLSTIITRLTLPIAAVTKSKKHLREYYLNALTVMFIAITPMLLGLAAIIEPAIREYADTTWLNAILVAQIFSITAILRIHSCLSQSFFLGAGLPHRSILMGSIRLTVALVTITIAGHSGLSVSGIALALLASEFLLLTIQLLLTRYSFGFSVTRTLGTMFRPTLISITMVSLILLSHHAIMFSIEFRLASSIAFGGVFYVLTTLYWRSPRVNEMLQTYRMKNE